MKRTVLLATVTGFAYAVFFAVVGVSLPLALAINGILPLLDALLWCAFGLIAWLYVSRSHSKNLKNLPLGSAETWFFTITFFFGIIALGVGLLSLSTFGAQTISTSRCISPVNTNVSSPNCIKIESVSQAPSGGLYSGWGNAGAFTVILGAVGLPSFLIMAIVNYIEYGRKGST